jgi:hypothetical protein
VSNHASPARARRWADLRYAVIAVASVALFAAFAIWMQSLSHELRVSNEARDALARQVQSLGEKPVAGPPGSRGEPGQSVTGPQGPRGPAGASGRPAPTITPRPGASGASGAPGKPGADSTVPGPSGAPGQGATGIPGRDGRDGVDGRDGADGKPPAGWTFEHGGATYTCRPVDDFDPDDPHYTCEAPEPSPEPSDSPQQPSSLALDPNRRRW